MTLPLKLLQKMTASILQKITVLIVTAKDSGADYGVYSKGYYSSYHRTKCSNLFVNCFCSKLQLSMQLHSLDQSNKRFMYI